MLIVIGLTGGIASGKSFVTSYLKKINIPVHESDEVIKHIYKKPTQILISFLKKTGIKNVINKKKKLTKIKLEKKFITIKRKKILLRHTYTQK